MNDSKFLKIKDIEIPISIKNYKNSKSVKIYFKGNALIITKPVRLSVKKLLETLKQNEDDIYNKYKKIASSEITTIKQWKTGEKIYYKGEEFAIIRQTTPKKRINIDIQLECKQIEITVPENIEQEIIKINVDKAIKKLLKRNTEIIIANKLSYWSKITGFEYNQVKVRDATTRYGSCIPTKKNLYFSSRLIMLPDNIIDAIIVHELCHMKYKNHNKDFYDLVARYIPNYKEIDKWLKKKRKNYNVLKGENMEIPQELKEAIEKIITGTKHKNIIKESQSISKKYRENDGKGKKLVTKQLEAVAYSISRMPATYCAVYSALSKVFKNYSKEIKTVLDVGAGTGAATWALQEFVKPQKIMCLEREQAMRDIGSKLMHNNLENVEWKEFDLVSDEIKENADLIVTSYVINELSEENRKIAIEKMWKATNDLLLIIEPGTPEGFKHINEARELLLAKDANIVAPCSHNGKCPINTQEDWCGFYVRVSRSGIQRQAKKGELSYEDEKFSYIAFSKIPVTPEQARILRHPQINSGYVKVKLCTQNGVEERTYSKKDGEVYKKIRKLDAGDTI